MASQCSVAGSHPMILRNASKAPTRSTLPVTRPAKRTRPTTPTAQAEDYVEEMTLLKSPDPLIPSAALMNKQAASEAQAKDAQDNGLAAADMLDQITKSLEHMREKGLRGVLVLGEAIEKLVQDYIKGELAPSTKPTVPNRQTDKAQTYASVAAAAAPTPIPKGPLPKKQKLRAELVELLAATIKTVQHIPTGIAITAHSIQDMETLLARKAEISAVLTGAKLEKEEHWVICIIPDLTPEYSSYVGGTQKLTAKQAAEEFELQTKLKPLQSRWARVQPGSTTTALILAFSPEVVASLPTRVTLFRWNRPVIKKALKVQI
ncbi:hypothetical protein VTO42DRAFT_4687 [Malbranchea cinnamomea]